MPHTTDPFIPCPLHELIVDLSDHRDMFALALKEIPIQYASSIVGGSCLGVVLKIAKVLLTSTGGRVTIFQHGVPTVGDGALLAMCVFWRST